jgi:heme exporter protein A
MLPTTLLAAHDLAATRGSHRLFSGVAFTLESGGVIALTGPNGSGKTTLLRMVAGLTLPTAGMLVLNGLAVAPGSPALRRHVAFAGHAAGLSGDLSARVNLDAAMAIAGMPVSVARIDQALARTGLGRAADLPARSLSQGQRRRVVLARLLLAAKPLWVLDEPATALDADGQALLTALLDEHLADGGAAIVATHQPMTVRGHAARLSLAAGHDAA